MERVGMATPFSMDVLAAGRAVLLSRATAPAAFFELTSLSTSQGRREYRFRHASRQLLAWSDRSEI
jgi:hypothetical protein